MADFHLNTSAPVPARWRIFFAVFLVLAFWAAGWHLWKDVPPSAPTDRDGNALDARIRLQTAAIAFSAGKLAPRMLILTDRPEFYEKESIELGVAKLKAHPEFRFFQNGTPGADSKLQFSQNSLHAIDPASIPGWGLESPMRSYGRLPSRWHTRDIPEQDWNNFRRTLEDVFGGFGLRAWDAAIQSKADELKKTVSAAAGEFIDHYIFRAAFDVILLDCVFPDRLLSRRLRLFSPAFFDRVKSGLLNSGGVFAVVLPPDRPEVSARILAFLQHSFGNAGAFCFGDRVILASGSDSVPVFDLEKLNDTAELAGYYDAGSIPDNAIALVLDEDYSDSIPAGLLEAADRIGISRVFTPYCAVFARAELMPRLTRFLPDGFPLRTVCAWILGILLAAYPFTRYFISWKPVHKQSFRAFEDMFYLTGALALFLMFSHEMMPDCGIQGTLSVLIYCLIFFSCEGTPRHEWVRRLFLFTGEERKRHLRHGHRSFGRVVLALLTPLLFGLAFFLPPAAYLTEFLALFGLCSATLLVRARMDEPVQPGPVIPVAFISGVIASLGMFAVCLCFPSGPVVFAAVVCLYRLILPD